MTDRPTVPLRLALVSRRYPPEIGGAELVMSYLAKALAQAGANVTVLTSALHRPGTESDPLVKPVKTSPLRIIGTYFYMWNLRNDLLNGKFDLLYISMLKHDAYVAVGVAKKLGIPVVLRPEGAGGTGDLAWQKWGRFGKTIGRKCKQADGFVAISRSIREELIVEGYDLAKIHDLPNGVPVPSVSWKARNGWEQSPHAVFVGRLAPEKNLDALIEQWPIVLEENPGAKLTLVGEGPLRPKLEALIERLNLTASVTMPGASNDPSSILRQADLFVLPSTEEGMSIALLEAMALGIPIVASAIPGNTKLVESEQHAILASLGSPSGIADAIYVQWANFERACTMGKEARKRVIESYSIENMAKQHLDLFHTILLKR